MSFDKWVAGRPGYQAAWTTQLLAVLPDVETVGDVEDWLGALTPALCETCPDLLCGLSERLACLLKEFAPEEVSECVTNCLDTAWVANPAQAPKLWANLCVELHSLSLPALHALLTCLLDQQKRNQLPAGGPGVINYCHAILVGMSKALPELGFGAAQGSTQVVPPEIPPVGFQENEHPGTRDVLKLVLAHRLQYLGIDWMRSMSREDFASLRDLLLIDKEFFACFKPMLANHPWIQKEARLGRDLTLVDSSKLWEQISKLIHSLVDVPAETVKSMGMPGVGPRRLDLILWTMFSGSMHHPPEAAVAAMGGAYGQLHYRMVFQRASKHQAMSPCFAQHIDLSALPLHFLTMAYRLLDHQGERFLPVIKWVAGNLLPAYPPGVQALTLMSLLSLLPDPELNEWMRSRLKVLMADPSSWPTLPHEWLSCQWSNLDGMLALIEDPSKVPDDPDQADMMANALLAALQRHHGVSDEPLLINDPFGEHYVLWTLADIRLLGALCQRAEAFGDWRPPALADCLVALLRQLCLVSVPGQRFVSRQFMDNFPADILHSAFIRLTSREQSLMLTGA